MGLPLRRFASIMTFNNETMDLKSVNIHKNIHFCCKEKSLDFNKFNFLDKASIKSTIQESLARPDGKIFTEDLKALLYSTRTDEDLDFLIKAIKRYNPSIWSKCRLVVVMFVVIYLLLFFIFIQIRYQSHESLTMFSYSFDAPLARLLYILGKMDLAVKLSC
jgi:uncharacterized integral membrane protein